MSILLMGQIILFAGQLVLLFTGIRNGDMVYKMPFIMILMVGIMVLGHIQGDGA